MRCYIFSGIVVLLMTSAEAQGQGRADRQYTRRPNVATQKPVPKKQTPAEDSSTKKFAEPEKKLTYPPNQLWSPRFSPLEPVKIRERNWENYYQNRRDEYQKQQAKQQAKQPAPQQHAYGNNQERYIADAPIRAVQKPNRQSVLGATNSAVLDVPWWSRYPVRPELNVIGDPYYGAPIDVEEERSLTSLAWLAEKPGLTAPLSFTTAPMIVPVPPTVPPTTITGLPMTGTATPMSLAAPTFMPAPLTVPPVAINTLPMAGTTTPTSPIALTIVPAPPTVPPFTLNALPRAATATQTSPTVNSPLPRSTTSLLPIESRTPAGALPPVLNDSAPAPPAGLTITVGTTDGLIPVPTISY